jgi:hypothetical protein
MPNDSGEQPTKHWKLRQKRTETGVALGLAEEPVVRIGRASSHSVGDPGNSYIGESPSSREELSERLRRYRAQAVQQSVSKVLTRRRHQPSRLTPVL